MNLQQFERPGDLIFGLFCGGYSETAGIVIRSWKPLRARSYISCFTVDYFLSCTQKLRSFCMGTFLAFSSVISKTEIEVVESLKRFTKTVYGGFEQSNDISLNSDNCCTVQEETKNTSVLYPNGYLEWDDSSQFISKDLNALVFSFHIHDGDLWMYVLYNKGIIIDQFNPIPDYWEDNVSEEEIYSWSGDATIVANHIPYIDENDINKYLVRWDLDIEEQTKAYTTDEYPQEDWQLIDFMRKLRLPIPIGDDGIPIGTNYRMWTKELKLTGTLVAPSGVAKPWWKLW